MASLNVGSWLKHIAAMLAFGLLLSYPAFAEEQVSETEAPAGIIPIHNYTGEIWSRSHVPGD